MLRQKQKNNNNWVHLIKIFRQQLTVSCFSWFWYAEHSVSNDWASWFLTQPKHVCRTSFWWNNAKSAKKAAIDQWNPSGMIPVINKIHTILKPTSTWLGSNVFIEWGGSSWLVINQIAKALSSTNMNIFCWVMFIDLSFECINTR